MFFLYYFCVLVFISVAGSALLVFLRNNFCSVQVKISWKYLCLWTLFYVLLWLIILLYRKSRLVPFASNNSVSRYNGLTCDVAWINIFILCLNHCICLLMSICVLKLKHIDNLVSHHCKALRSYVDAFKKQGQKCKET